MKELKQIGCIHFYVQDDATEIFTLIENICKGLGQYVSAVRCEKLYGEIEFKYSFSANHYSIKCGFNKHNVQLMDIYDPVKNIKPYGIPYTDWMNYDNAIHEAQQISILQNKILTNIKSAFRQLIQKNNGE